VRSDEIFYRVFKESPTTYFELIGVPAETAANYKYTAEELKHAGLRLDGLFVPTRPEAPVHFVEAFTYKTQHAYSNLLAKVFLWLDTHNPLQEWRAGVIFLSRALEPNSTGPYQELLESGRIRRVFLEELAEPGADQIGLGILELIACPAAATLSKAKLWVERVRGAKQSITERRRLVELIEIVVLGRLPNLARKELKQMLQLVDYRESKVFAEGVEEGIQKGIEKGIEKGMEKGKQQALEQVALRMLAKGDLPAEVARTTGLAVAHIKRLKRKKTGRD
jgi:predicted transposase/invertase (TIGR01784 family)